jgi:Holliday junction resolvase RusA-like endonuclease
VIRLPIAPVAAPRQSRRDKFDPSPAVVRYRAFCEELGIRAKQAGWWPGDTLDVTFRFAMPASWSGKKRREMDGKPHQQKPDTDNLVKALCDCLLDDDSHVWDVRARKVWGVFGEIEVGEGA